MEKKKVGRGAGGASELGYLSYLSGQETPHSKGDM